MEGKDPKSASSITPKPGVMIVDSARQAAAAKTAPRPLRRYRAFLFTTYLGIGVMAFTLLMLAARTVPYFSVDLSVTRFIQQFQPPWFDSLMYWVSWIGFPPQAPLVPLLFAALALVFGYHWETVMILGTAGVVQAVNTIIKAFVARPRPDANLVHVLNELSSYSFPSGHVMFYTAFFGFLAFLVYTLFKRSWWRTALGIFFTLLVLLVGPSRIYQGEHWFSDVMAAYLMGSIVLIAMILVYNWGKQRFFVRQPAAPEAGPDPSATPAAAAEAQKEIPGKQYPH